MPSFVRIVRWAPASLVCFGVMLPVVFLNSVKGKAAQPPLASGSQQTASTPTPSQTESPTDASAWEYHFTGEKCFSKGSYVPEYREGGSDCFLKHFCNTGEKKKCAQWGTGLYTKVRRKKPASRPARACTGEEILTNLATGRWDANGTSFTLPGCAFTTIDRDFILKLFKGKTVLFSGDSIMRQLYIRLIGLLRGEEIFIEHYYHKDSYYACNGESDALTVTDGKPKENLLKGDSTPTFEMYYVWDPFPSKLRTTFVTLKPDIHFASHMYWWKAKDPFNQVDKFIQKARDLAMEWPSYKLFYLTTPWTAEGTFGGVDASRRVPRNSYVTKHLQSPPHPNIRVLDYSAFADVRKFDKTPDGIHYMCIWRPKYPEAIKPKEGKMKPSGCADHLNGNWLTIMLNAVAVL